MKLRSYLLFNGDCEAAFKFYEKVLGGKVTFKMTYGESPTADQIPPEFHKLIIHATLAVGDELLMGSDAHSGRYQQPQGIFVSLHLIDTSKGESIFNALAENGNVQMPFQQTFWSPGFGMCIDRFGIPWMVNCEQSG